ncbi:hypothetical protein ACQEU5_03320 [Marinactinospora thermotolerans]|uniref:Uncharacterized protein n=1 Tax=Marinactinospora thermotolerans DSM 45154 TaxID=1122192 RepID=A0A1T4LET1_9ACTN|nr:hypothetical protein [Marinactinospora thermotolerans]SJZ53067.1 hypothetical protein SAMN02745673_00643 [Marinactinospora thermotolerans DSM 45154]
MEDRTHDTVPGPKPGVYEIMTMTDEQIARLPPEQAADAHQRLSRVGLPVPAALEARIRGGEDDAEEDD